MDIDVYALIDRYYADNLPLRTLLIQHSESVAAKALEVLDAHPGIEADRELVYNGAMLHDIGIFMTNAPGIHCHGTEPYICHGMLGGAILRREGLDRLALFAERHTGTGLTPETIQRQGLPLPLDVRFVPESVEEEIVCYADKFFSKSHPESEKTVEQVRMMLSRFPDADLERWDDWVRRFS